MSITIEEAEKIVEALKVLEEKFVEAIGEVEEKIRSISVK
jgi:hypothetical protein